MLQLFSLLFTQLNSYFFFSKYPMQQNKTLKLRLNPKMTNRAFTLTYFFSFQYGNVLIHTEVSLIFAFMSAYTISTIMLSFFLSTLFNRANIAAAAGGIIFFCIYLPYSFMVVWESKITHSIRIATVRFYFYSNHSILDWSFLEFTIQCGFWFWLRLFSALWGIRRGCHME